jgi:hypothetical protein
MLNNSPPKGDAAAAAVSPSKRDQAGAGPAIVAQPAKKKFQNGWTREIEKLMAEWADKAICYRWMHEKTERSFHTKDMAFMFPVIILSTVTGAANFAMDSMLSDPEQKKYAQLALGGLSIATGIISTIANRLGYASGSEAHKGAAVLWGKFQRLIAIELSLHPNERSDCMHFLKMCRAELDRLIEQSPTIPDTVIAACKAEFKQYPNVRKPEIVGDIDTTSIFVDTNSRLKELAKEAAITIQQKKGVLKQIVLDDLEPRISRVIENSTLPAIKEELRKDLQKAAEKATREAVAAVVAGRVTAASATAAGGSGTASVLAPDVAKAAAERAEEVQAVAMSGLVKEMRRKLGEADAKYSEGAPVALPGLAGLKPVRETINIDNGVIFHVHDDSDGAAAGEGEGEGDGDGADIESGDEETGIISEKK